MSSWWGSSKSREYSDVIVTYRSFREAEDDNGSLLRENGGVGYIGLIRSRSETDLASSAASLALPPPAPNFTPLHRCLRVLAGSWKNLFLGGMSRGGKPAAKKVAPPSVPETSSIGPPNSNNLTTAVTAFRNSGSSFGSSQGYSSASEDQVFTDLRDGYEANDSIYGMGSKSPGTFSYPAFTFPGPQQYNNIGGKTTFYHHQLSLQEDQGIDMTQSPGRDSPGSSGSGSRHSTVSLDSGRASSCHLSAASSSIHQTSQHRPSLSSSSGDSAISHRVERLIVQGVPDQDVLNSWLMDLHFDEYYPLFVNAGYDMHTISRMTPEDLTAIGIKKPNHRKKLKSEIAQLNISDGLPDYIPGSLDEWLKLLRLESYGNALRNQGYQTVDDTTKIQVEDLEDIGIVKLGHQKRFLLAIKRLQDLKAGKIFPPTPFTPTMQVECTDGGCISTSLDCDCPRVHTIFKTFHQPWEIESTRSMYYTTDIVPIKIRGGRGKSLESLEGCETPVGGGTSSFMPLPPPPPPRIGRYYEDGDLTPTNECNFHPQTMLYNLGGGTLPRPRALMKHRPQAKIPPLTFQQPLQNEIYVTNMSNNGTLKRCGPPLPPTRTVSNNNECSSSVTVVADLHHPAPHQYNSDSSFKSSSSTESDSLPFANENAGTIKQRAARNPSEYVPPPPIRIHSPSSSSSSLLTLTPSLSRKASQDTAEDVLNDIGNMLANLTDELDAMLEEEKRQGLTDN